jgi:antitoxin Phd
MTMSPPSRQRTARSGKRSQSVAGLERWKLEDAKARFSEVVRLAGTDGPQLVTIRGKEAAVILAPETYEQLLPKPKGHKPLVRFLQNLGLDRIEIERETDTGRDVAL